MRITSKKTCQKAQVRKVSSELHEYTRELTDENGDRHISKRHMLPLLLLCSEVLSRSVSSRFELKTQMELQDVIVAVKANKCVGCIRPFAGCYVEVALGAGCG